MDEIVIGSIEKNRTEEYRVRVAEFHDRPYVDVQVFAVANAVDRTPTRKGLAVGPDKVGALIELLRQPQAQAHEAGLLDTDRAVLRSVGSKPQSNYRMPDKIMLRRARSLLWQLGP